MRAEPFLVSRFSCQEEKRKTTTDPNLPEDIPKNNNNNVVGDVFISRGEIFGLWPLNSLSFTIPLLNYTRWCLYVRTTTHVLYVCA